MTEKTTKTTKTPIADALGEQGASLTIVVDEISYIVDDLPAAIKDRISIYQAWENDLNAAKLEVFKLEAARHGLSFEIESMVRQFNFDKKTGK